MDYRFIIDNMRWSFSRLDSFDQCKYGWKKKYIDCEDDEGNCFSSYGSLCHSLLEEYEKGLLDPLELGYEYENRFDKKIQEEFPPNKYKDLRESYFYKGLEYFEGFDEKKLIGNGKIISSEHKVEFEIEGYPFVGFIDLWVEEDGKNILIDHKSASLSFSKRTGKPTKKSEEKMKHYARQQYLYSKALLDDGIKVDYLAWNFFNEGIVYRIPWNKNEYQEAIQWSLDTIHRIENETDWAENYDQFFCKYICGCRSNCEMNYDGGEVEWL